MSELINSHLLVHFMSGNILSGVFCFKNGVLRQCVGGWPRKKRWQIRIFFSTLLLRYLYCVLMKTYSASVNKQFLFFNHLPSDRFLSNIFCEKVTKTSNCGWQTEKMGDRSGFFFQLFCCSIHVVCLWALIMCHTIFSNWFVFIC